MNHYTYDEIRIGQKESFEVTITEEMMEMFLKITGDNNPLHNDEDYAVKRGHPGKVVYGMLTASFLSTLAGVYLPGERSLIHSVDIKLRKPVYVGDVLKIEGVVSDKSDSVRVITVKYTITNNDAVKVSKGEMQIGIE